MVKQQSTTNTRVSAIREQCGTGAMNLDNVLPFPLDFNPYVETAIKILTTMETLSKKQLLKQLQNVCAVYACLSVKRNAGIVGTQQKFHRAAQTYREIAVPGFFRSARDNNFEFPAWLTFEKMGQSTLTGKPVLFHDGKKLWGRFDAAMRVMKRDYNKAWDRFVQGQPGGNLPSGQSGDDAVENLLNGVHFESSGSADNPVEEENLMDNPPPSGGGRDNPEADAGGDGGQKQDTGGEAREEQQQGGGGKQQDGGGESSEESDRGLSEKKQEDNGDEIAGGGKAIKQEDDQEKGDGNSDGEEGPDSPEYPPRPGKWMAECLLIFCLIGRPSSSEHPDLKTAKSSSGPPNRNGKRKSSTLSTSSPEGSECGSYGPGSDGNLDSTAIRTFVGAGESQSRAEVKKETAAVATNVATQKFRQQRLAQGAQIANAVQSLSNALVSRQRLDEAAERRAQDQAAQAKKDAKVQNLKTELEFTDPESHRYLTLRSAIITVLQLPISVFMPPTPPGATWPGSSAATAPASAPASTPASAAGAASPTTSAATSTAVTPASTLPGFSGANRI